MQTITNNPYVITGWRDWYVYSQNSYQSTCVICWYMLMGVKNEESHYFKLLNVKSISYSLGLQNVDEAILTALLLKEAGLTEAEFYDYWNRMKIYRNKYLNHRTLEENLEHPFLDRALQTLKAVHTIIQNVAQGHPGQADEINNTEFRFQFIKTDDLETYFKNTIPEFLRTLAIAR